MALLVEGVHEALLASRARAFAEFFSFAEHRPIPELVDDEARKPRCCSAGATQLGTAQPCRRLVGTEEMKRREIRH